MSINANDLRAIALYVDTAAKERPDGSWDIHCFTERHGGDRTASANVTVGQAGNLLAYCQKCGSIFDDVIQAAAHLMPRINGHRRQPAPPAPSPTPTPTPAVPAPLGVSAPDFTRFAPAGSSYLRHWQFTTAEGEIVCYVARFEDAEGKKSFMPFTWGGETWKPKGLKGERPMWNLGAVMANPTAAVIVCEGEGKAEDLGRHLGAVVVAWMGGAKAWSKTDWTPLRGRKVVVWPDNDAVGVEAGEGLAALLRGMGCAVRLVKADSSAPAGWDAGDLLHQEPLMDGAAVGAWIRAHLVERITPERVVPTAPAVPEQQQEDDGSEGLSVDDFSEIAMSFQLVDRSAGNIAYVPQFGKWMLFYDGAWREDSKLQIYSMAKRVAIDFAAVVPESRNGETARRALKSKRTVAAIVNLAQSDSRVARVASDFDNNPMWLNTPGGTVDLATGAIRPHDRADMMTLITNVSPDFDAQCPVFDRFMAEVFNGDQSLVDYVMAWLGYCMSGRNDLHELHFWHGQGRNGKSTLIELYSHILGSYATKMAEDVLTQKSGHGHGHASQLAVLRGRRVGFASEIAEGQRWDEVRIKTLTGDADITANYMRQDFFTFKREIKPIVIANSRPTFSHVDVALRERIKLIPFAVSFAGREDRDLPMKLRAEAPAVMAKIIRAGVNVFNGQRAKCAAVQEMSNEYMDEMDDLKLFADECCEPFPAEAVPSPASELLSAFNVWKGERGESKLSKRRFSERMRGKYGDTRKSDGLMVYAGVRLGREWERRAKDAIKAARERAAPRAQLDFDDLALRSGVDMED